MHIFKRPDVIIATSPQSFTLISALLNLINKNVPFVIEIRDMWPESVVSVGAMKKQFTKNKILANIAKLLYKRQH